VAAFLPVDAEGRVLLMQRDDRPGLPHPGQWNLIGGLVEAGESVEEAVVRETREEIGFNLFDYEKFAVFKTGRLADAHVFFRRLDLPVELLTLGEGQALRFFTPAEIDSLPLVPLASKVLMTFLASQQYSKMKA
jgi:8-oxo-dGTP diphosphatase